MGSLFNSVQPTEPELCYVNSNIVHDYSELPTCAHGEEEMSAVP
jgi:hypothetical protein